MDLKKLLGDVPWITKEGYFDPGQFPIEGVLKQAFSDDEQEFRTGLSVLSSMYGHGRTEAGIFLLGVLVNCEDHSRETQHDRRGNGGHNTKPCADLLFGELKRVKGSNTTRRYLGTVIKVLATMPLELTEAGFETLAEDRSFSPKMREKFRAVLASGLMKTIGDGRGDQRLVSV